MAIVDPNGRPLVSATEQEARAKRMGELHIGALGWLRDQEANEEEVLLTAINVLNSWMLGGPEAKWEERANFAVNNLINSLTQAMTSAQLTLKVRRNLEAANEQEKPS